VLQVRQLVLDPAVSKEFQRQQRELEERSRQVMQLKEDLDGVQFTQVRWGGVGVLVKGAAVTFSLYVPMYFEAAALK
jgi:hypothetical protein